MLRRDKAIAAAGEVLAAALLGDGWTEALQRLADATEAGGVTLMRLHQARPLAAIASTDWREADAALLGGHAPASPRRFFPDHVFGHGFLGDTNVWAIEEFQRDAYFQDFLRPRGVFFHAKARLLVDGDERISVSLKRRSSLGPYEPKDIAVLDAVLTQLRASVRIARRVLDAETFGMVRLLHRRGEPVFELDQQGGVLRVHGSQAEHLGLLVRNRRLTATESRWQPQLDRAVTAAARSPQRPALVVIANSCGERRFLQIVPVTGRARDVFHAAAAIAVLIELAPRSAISRPFLAAIRGAMGLTTREAQIAALLAEGLSLTQIADRLHVGIGTARNHLKTIFDKCGVRRQGELVALLSRLKH